MNNWQVSKVHPQLVTGLVFIVALGIIVLIRHEHVDPGPTQQNRGNVTRSGSTTELCKVYDENTRVAALSRSDCEVKFVVAEEGRPVANVELRIERADSANVMLTTSSDGTALIHLSEITDTKMSWKARGFLEGSALLSPESRGTRQLIELSPSCVIEGRISDKNGVAIERAVVRILAKSRNSQDMSRVQATVQKTDANGIYRAENLELHTTVDVVASADGSISNAVQYGLYSDYNRLDIQIAPAGSVTGRLIPCKERPKQPIPQMEVSIVPTDDFGGTTCQWATTSPENPTFEFRNLPKGSYRLTAKQRSGGQLSCRPAVVALGSGENMANVTLEVHCGELVSGFVSLAPDQTAISTRVDVVNGKQVLTSTTSNDQGSFCVEVASLPLTAEVVAGAGVTDGFVTTRAAARPQERINLIVTPSGRGVLVVKGLKVGKELRMKVGPLEDGSVDNVIVAPGSRGYSAELEPGRYRVILLNGRTQIAAGDVVIEAGQTTEWDINRDSMSLEVRLVDGLTGNVLPNGKVATEVGETPIRWAITDAKGIVTVRSVIPGATSIVCDAVGFGRRVIAVPEDVASRLDIDLYAEATIRAIVDEGSVVQLLSALTGREVRPRTAFAGSTVLFSGLEAGCYCVLMNSTRRLECVASGDNRTLDLRAHDLVHVRCRFRAPSEEDLVVPALAGVVCLCSPYEVIQAHVDATGVISFSARESCDYMVFGVVENGPTLLAIMRGGASDGIVRVLERPSAFLTCENMSSSPLALRVSMSEVGEVAFEQTFGRPLFITGMSCGIGETVRIEGLLPGSYVVSAAGGDYTVKLDAFSAHVQVPAK